MITGDKNILKQWPTVAPRASVISMRTHLFAVDVHEVLVEDVVTVGVHLAVDHRVREAHHRRLWGRG